MHEAIATRLCNNLDPLKVDTHRISFSGGFRLFFSIPKALPCNTRSIPLFGNWFYAKW
jgi:hypothetical protein